MSDARWRAGAGLLALWAVMGCGDTGTSGGSQGGSGPDASLRVRSDLGVPLGGSAGGGEGGGAGGTAATGGAAGAGGALGAGGSGGSGGGAQRDAGPAAGGALEADAGPVVDAAPAGTPDMRPGPRVHPEGYSDSAVHGPELKRGAGDCRTCHGPSLEGGRGPSCDSCHPEGWRTDCTFCHGGTDTQTGAPPRDLDGHTDRASQRFAPHTEHTTQRNHAAYGCEQCHVRPHDVMSPGHVFDETPGDAEVDFSGGLSPGATWSAQGQCDNVYCHGNGRVPGAIAHTAARPTCDTCHSWLLLGGHHLQHFIRLVGCVSCHNATADAAQAIVGPDRHANGTLDVVFEDPAIAFQGGQCNGSCHGENHNNRGW